MSDLFGLSPADEMRLYREDRKSWAKHAAPRWVEIMRREQEGVKKLMWSQACPELRAEIRRLSA